MEKKTTVVILRCDEAAPRDIENVELAQQIGIYAKNAYELAGNNDDYYAAIFPKHQKTIVKCVTVKNFKEIVRSVCPDPLSDDFVFFNICDGVDIDGFPGRSVAKFLEDEKYYRYPFDLDFSFLCSHKIQMKKKFDEHGVSTAAWVEIGKTWTEEKRQQVLKLKFPLIVKVSNFYCSLGITYNSRCDTIDKVEEHVKGMIPVYGEVFVEEFIIGREFTVLLIDDKDGGVHVYPPTEILFPESMPLEDRFLRFEMETKDKIPIEEMLVVCPPQVGEPLKALSIAAYKALGGKKYARLDIRQNIETGVFYVLEVNDLPALGPELYVDEILQASGLTLQDFGNRVMELTPHH